MDIETDNDNTNNPDETTIAGSDATEPTAEEAKPEEKNDDTKPEAKEPSSIAGGETKEPEEKTEPIAYDFSESLPEGWNIDEQSAAEFSDIANKLKLDNGQANTLASYGYKFAAKAVAAVEAKHREEIQEWGQETVKTLGKDLDKHKALCGVAMESLEKDYPNIRKVLNESGLGNKYEIVMAFSKLGELLQQDPGKIAGVKGAKKNDDHDWYPNSH